MAALGQFVDYLAANGLPGDVADLKRRHVEDFIISLRERGLKPATANNRYRALAGFFKWCVAEEEIQVSPMNLMSPPKVPVVPPAVLKDDELFALLRVCRGKRFNELRDTAIILLLIETGIRVSELAGLKVKDVFFFPGPDDEGGEVDVENAKGGRSRRIGFGDDTGEALDLYLRKGRPKHRFAGRKELFLGASGRMTGNGIGQIVRRRAREAGLSQRVYPHLFRHTWAHLALKGGQTEGNVMSMAGWTSRAMLGRYGASMAAERARESYRRNTVVRQLYERKRTR